MIAIGSIVAAIYIFYAAYMTYFFTGLLRLNNNPLVRNHNESKISVVVAARNEEENIGYLLEDLSKQTYPSDKIQIIVVDDRSTDKTWSIINEFCNNYDNIDCVQITEPSKSMTPKKHALTKAIEQSNGEFIISTDADCRVPTTWAESMVGAFNRVTGVVVGYSKIDTFSERVFDHYQSIDYLALMSANAGTLGWGNAWTGSGQNIAYRRTDFDKINGFNPVANQISGDDFYLVQAISKVAIAKYNTDPNSFVKTKPSDNFSKFINQRIRWASNTKKLFNTDYSFLSFLFTNLFINILLLLALLLKSYWPFLPMLFGIKFLIDTAVLFYGSKILKTEIKINAYLIWFFLQPIYTPILGVLSIMGKFRWKT